MQALAADN